MLRITAAVFVGFVAVLWVVGAGDASFVDPGVYNIPASVGTSLMRVSTATTRVAPVDFLKLHMQLGTPPQNLRFIADTGSWEPWVFLDGCMGECGGPLFNTSASTTYRPNGTAVHQSQYAAGIVSYIDAMDTLRLGWPSDAPLSDTIALPGAGMGLVFNSTLVAGFADGVSGLIGLGPMGLPLPTPVQPLLEAIAPLIGAQLNASVMGIAFPRQLSPKPIGALSLGGVDGSRFQGDTLTWVPLLLPSVTRLPFWMVNVTGAAVNGAPVTSCSTDTACPAVLDTGGGVLVLVGPGVPDIDVWANCSNMATLPTVSLAMGGFNATFPPEAYVRKVKAGADKPLCLSQIITSLPDARAAADSLPRIDRLLSASAAANASSIVYLGGIFFEQAYTAIDWGNAQVGFGHHAR